MRSNKIMNREEVCEYFGVCKGTITRWIKQEGFPQATKEGRERIWKFSQIENWVHSKKVHPPENPKFRNQIARIKLSPNYQPPEQGLEKLKKIAQKAKKTSERLLSRQELCEHFEVSIGSLNRWIRSDNFPKAHSSGTTVSWKLSEVEDWVMAKKCTPSQGPLMTPEEPKQELLTINPAFEEKILQGVIENITAAIQPKIEQDLAQTTNQIINKIANDLLSNYGR